MTQPYDIGHMITFLKGSPVPPHPTHPSQLAHPPPDFVLSIPDPNPIVKMLDNTGKSWLLPGFVT